MVFEEYIIFASSNRVNTINMGFELNANNFRSDIEGVDLIRIGFNYVDSGQLLVITYSYLDKVYNLLPHGNGLIKTNQGNKTWDIDKAVLSLP